MGRHTIVGFAFLLFFYIGGVRQRSPYAAIAVFLMYFLDTGPVIIVAGLTGAIVMRVLLLALLLSNVRATWIAAHWQPNSEEATLPLRLNETLRDKFTNQLPTWLWPKTRYFYYVYSALLTTLTVFGLILQHRHH